ncbi:hypothetical protein SAMN04487950_0363 [Halogranum rubrum]|uniref:Uncharacterized protein n=1 Tax=Halogranum rubrum TaxID=553466 RepID=A0A1I4B6Y0_9EURY|nr:hypothetical protein [Halogranum rubrum]SFK64628.1 hypothetical protein SAMN04487950_0363 [Halogranum rubrum]
MSKLNEETPNEERESIHEQYVLDVRIVECVRPDVDRPQYRFEAPEHTPMSFDDPEMAELYADIYFCTNGFVEEGTGERGVPPEVIGAGRAVLAAYFLTQPGTDRDWVASFFGKKPHRVRKYVEWVQGQAEEIRTGVVEQGLG